MIYIYDVLLNFTDNYYYDFYEWMDNDNYINVKKVPVIRVNKKTIEDFVNYKIKVNSKFLKRINNKSIFLKKDKEKYNYTVILSCGIKSIGVSFNEKGLINYISSMLLDEEEDTNRIVINQNEEIIKYKKYKNKRSNILRFNMAKKKEIIRELKEEFLNKEYDKLKYIYYEIYNKIDNDINYIYNKILSDIDNIIDDITLVFDELKIKKLFFFNNI